MLVNMDVAGLGAAACATMLMCRGCMMLHGRVNRVIGGSRIIVDIGIGHNATPESRRAAPRALIRVNLASKRESTQSCATRLL